MAVGTRLCLFLAAVIAAVCADLADVVAGPETCRGPAPTSSVNSSCASDPAEASMTTSAVIGVVAAQVVVCLVVVIAFQRHMKPKQE